jgi:hypothetical protein
LYFFFYVFFFLFSLGLRHGSRAFLVCVFYCYSGHRSLVFFITSLRFVLFLLLSALCSNRKSHKQATVFVFVSCG